jgi:CPA2 family monovalent cation:H+ antiporter-2
MGPTDFALEVMLVIGAAVIGAAVFERLRLPAVAGFLVTGAIVGPGGLGLVEDPDRVRVLAEFGVALLLFQIGLELPIEALRRIWRTVILSGALQVSLTVACVAALAAAFGASIEAAIVMGMLVSLSSTALVMRVLAQRGEVDAPHGRLSVGILLFQDLCLVPFLLAVPILSGEVERSPIPLALAIGRDLVALAILYGGARFLLPWILERVARLRSPDLFSLFAFLMAIGSALLAEEIGLTLAVGAFIAGLVLSASPYAHQLFAEVVPLRGVLLGIFFTAVGMLFDAAAAVASWQGILLFVGGVVIVKAGIIVFVLALVLRQGLRLGILTGLGLAQTGEFSFVLAAVVAPLGLLDESLKQIFVAGSVLTLVATPLVVDTAPRLSRVLIGLFEQLGLRSRAGADLSEPAEGVSDHVVIVGCGLAGQTLARVLKASDIAYRSVDQNPHLVAEARKRGDPALFGDATRSAILERLGVTRARLVCIAINDPAATRRCISQVRHVAPDVRIVARAHYVQELDQLLADGASEVVAEEFESTIELFSTVLRAFDIPHQAIEHFAGVMRMEGYEFTRSAGELPIDPWLAEVLQEVSTEWLDVPESVMGEHSIVDLQIRSRTGVNIVAVQRRGATTANPPPDFAIRAGDSLLVLASSSGLRQLRELLAGVDRDLRLRPGR